MSNPFESYRQFILENAESEESRAADSASEEADKYSRDAHHKADPFGHAYASRAHHTAMTLHRMRVNHYLRKSPSSPSIISAIVYHQARSKYHATLASHHEKHL